MKKLISVMLACCSVIIFNGCIDLGGDRIPFCWEEDGVVHCASVMGWGNDFSWKLSYDGTLSVDLGTLDSIYINWTYTNNPWAEHRDNVRKIVFTDRVIADTSLRGLFANLPNLRVIEGLQYFDTSNTTDMGWMFNGARSLETLDLSAWDMSNVTNTALMFRGTDSLRELIIEESFEFNYNSELPNGVWQSNIWTRQRAGVYGEISIYIGMRRLEPNIPPVIVGNRVLVSFETLAEALDVHVDWIDENRLIAAQMFGGRWVEMDMYNRTTNVKFTRATMDAPPIFIDNVAMVPLRFIAEMLIFDVEWNEDISSVIINTY